LAITAKNLVPSAQIAAALTTYYTATNVRAIIDKATICNDSAGAVSVDVHIVPQGGTADSTNIVISDKSINADETYTCPELVGHVLESGSFLRAVASAATSLTFRVSGREVTL
jgi:hypothetical protein